MKLSDEQRSAVQTGPVDLFIGAGAGSGKTRVLTARFVQAVLGAPPYAETPPRAILTVTFTDRAAGELAERIRGTLVSEGAASESRHVEDAWISTIHGMCSRILRQHAFEAGLDPRFGVATEVEAGILAHEAAESSIRKMVDAGDEGVTRLIEMMSITDVMMAVRGLHAGVRSMGRPLTDLRPMSTEGVAACLESLAAALERIAEQIASTCRMNVKTIAGNVGCIESAAAAVHAIASGSQTTESESDYAPKKPSRLGSDELHDGLVEEAKPLLDEVGLLQAQRAVRPYEEALCRLLVRFDREYAALKTSRSLLDFEDLQVMVADLLESQPQIAEEYRQRFRMVMVDEFQDTNMLQLQIAEQLSENNLCTVGDDKQSIYSFRHADVEVFRARERAAARIQRLADNYRSHPELLQFFNGMFGQEPFFGSDLMPLQPGERDIPGDGWPQDRARARVTLVDIRKENGLSGPEAEAVAVAEEFAVLREQGVPQGDMVLLLRKMKGRAELFERELQRRGFDVFIASGGTYFDTPEAGELVALLRLADNAFDDQAAVTVLAGRLTGTSDEGLFLLRAAAGKQGSLWTAARSAADLPLCDADRRVIARTVDAVEWMRSRRGMLPLRDLLLGVCEELDYDLALFASGPQGVRAWANVLKLACMAEEFEKSTHADIGSFLDYLALREEHVTSEQQATIAGERARSVRIMSVHAAKGLEFPVVAVASFSGGTPGPRPVVAGLVDGSLQIGMRLPLPEGSRDRSAPTLAHTRLVEQASVTDAEEVKRLLYVACTRAERGLVLCMSGDLTREPASARPLDLVLRSLGFTERGPESDASVELPGGSRVTVSVVRPTLPVGVDVAKNPAPRVAEPPSLAPAAREVKVRFAAPATISYSGLDLYLQCPYRFYAEKVASIASPSLGAGAGGTGPREFGNAFHEAMRDTFGPNALTDARMFAIALAHGIDGDGVRQLGDAVASFTSSRAAAEVRTADHVVPECPINVSVGMSTLVGSIDLLAWTGDEALVVDYKTGAGELSEEEARIKYELQASCYALAALRFGAQRVRVVFFEPQRNGRELEFPYAPGDIESIDRRIRAMLDAMAEGAFPPLAEYSARTCKQCAVFGTLCPVTPRVAG
jgi:ATP-dependent exoDNAse (exonuclease V) beta subunit